MIWIFFAVMLTLGENEKLLKLIQGLCTFFPHWSTKLWIQCFNICLIRIKTAAICCFQRWFFSIQIIFTTKSVLWLVWHSSWYRTYHVSATLCGLFSYYDLKLCHLSCCDTFIYQIYICSHLLFITVFQSVFNHLNLIIFPISFQAREDDDPGLPKRQQQEASASWSVTTAKMTKPYLFLNELIHSFAQVKECSFLENFNSMINNPFFRPWHTSGAEFDKLVSSPLNCLCHRDLTGMQHLVECVCVGADEKKHYLCTLCGLTVGAHVIIKHVLSFDHIFWYFVSSSGIKDHIN